MSAKMQQIYIYYVPVTTLIFDIRVFDMDVFNMAFIEDALVEILEDDVVIKSGYTDEDGKYTTTLGAGTYEIRISKTGYQTITKTETLNYPTEIMVNLPLGRPLPPEYTGILAISGRCANNTISESGEVDNTWDAQVSISEVGSVDMTPDATETISESGSVEVT